MKVILLDAVRGFGKFGDMVNVKPGFARNFLIPSQKAVFATKDNMASFEAKRAELEKVALEKLAVAKASAERLEKLASISLSAEANTEGKLFGSIGVAAIVKAINEAGVPVERSEVILSGGAIGQIGEYEADILLHSEVSLKLKVIVSAA
jgi:large subunit ribosomal protein L9